MILILIHLKKTDVSLLRSLNPKRKADYSKDDENGETVENSSGSSGDCFLRCCDVSEKLLFLLSQPQSIPYQA
jgi:molybdopterin/thiamine biosynthesis adenylyltransferase